MAAALVSGRSLIVDSDVLIWFMRGNPKAVAALEGAGDWYISAVSYMELVQGCRNKTELKAIQKAFKSGEEDILPLTQDISSLACTLVEKYSLSHSVYLADALIAATALQHDLPLLTANTKHFSAITSLKVKAFRP
ncbi:type II toxin-antitoxin system VapC family toxin [Polaromonas sp.]|uniref:type II toxin-antitoxin system VapC family toxin n=1 Tax=Polaromonas sp. TaxID=1869339 RepID=UPI0025D3FEDA|nr:type II toxin-antitoxin system VapC family toxin [Polaromonas sp.]